MSMLRKNFDAADTTSSKRNYKAIGLRDMPMGLVIGIDLGTASGNMIGFDRRMRAP